MKPAQQPKHAHDLLQEADIGSGEKTLAERETEALIRSIPPLPDGEGEGERDNERSSELDEDVAAATTRREHDASLTRDDPDDLLDNIDPVPPE